MTDLGAPSDLIAKVQRFRVVIAPTGRAFAAHRQAYIDTCEQSFTVSDVLALRAPPEATVIVITDLESVTADGPSLLGKLRSQVMMMLETGCSILMLSRYPRLRYPDVPGSALLDDARPYHPQLRIAVSESHPLTPFPDWGGDTSEVSFLTELVEELGTELAARLDQVLFESPLESVDSLNNLSATELDALWFAGLVTPTDKRYEWSAPLALPQLKEAVANCLTLSVDPPADLSAAYAVLWRIERRIRHVIRAKAVATWGDSWKESVAGQYRNQVLSRAGEVAYPGVKKVGLVRDPLEWLTLSELLRIREDKTQLGKLGLEPVFWRRFANEVLPIRNQVSHMRFTRPGDVTQLRHWDVLLERMLKED